VETNYLASDNSTFSGKMNSSVLGMYHGCSDVNKTRTRTWLSRTRSEDSTLVLEEEDKDKD